MTRIKNDAEIPQELIDALTIFQLENWPDSNVKDMSILKNIEKMIYEGDDYNEDIDSNYLTQTYFLEINNNIRIERIYSQYRKDGGLRAGDWEDGIYYIKK